MTEKEMWLKLRVSLGQVAHMTRIENAVSFGVPDINIAYNGVEFWIETKVAVSGKVKLRPSQIAWILHRLKVCHNVFLLVYEKDVFYLYRLTTRILVQSLESYSGITRLNLHEMEPFDTIYPPYKWFEMLENIVALDLKAY